jgi:hypothetical protein
VDHYEVGTEVISQFEENHPQDSHRIFQQNGSGIHLDLWTANELQLKRAGVEQVQVSGVCTACHLDDWFSHRAEKGKTGRFGALMALK